MVALSKPSSSEWESVANFIDNEKPLVKDQRNFILRKEDLVTLRPGREYAWLDSFIERLLRWCNSPLLDVSIKTSDSWICANLSAEYFSLRGLLSASRNHDRSRSANPSFRRLNENLTRKMRFTTPVQESIKQST